MAVFPESMDRLDTQNAPAALSIIENYIRYITERTEFAMRNMSKSVSAAGVSSVELYVLVQAQAQAIAAIQSALNQLQGGVTALQTTVGGSNSGLVKDVADIMSDIQDINDAIGPATTPGTILYQLAQLDQRVTALENPNNGGE